MLYAFGFGRLGVVVSDLYFVDPKYAEDPDTKRKGEVTLSYTFYPAIDAKPAATTAKASAAKPASGLGGPGAAGL